MRAWFVNLGPSSTTPAEADADILALAETGADVVAGCESIGKHPLVEIPGMQRITNLGTPGRANLFAYVRGEATSIRWTDCALRFPRNQHPNLGPHPARGILRFTYQKRLWVIGHQAPEWPGAGPARQEYEAKLERLLAPWTDVAKWSKRTHESRVRASRRGRVLLWDCNGVPEAADLAKRVQGELVGNRVDNAIVRRVGVVDKGYKRIVGGHRLSTDHKSGAFWIKLDLG